MPPAEHHGGTSPPAEQRVLEALYSAAGLAFMALVVWQQLNPGGPGEWWQRVRERVSEWRRQQRELEQTLAEIDALPETEPGS